MDKKLMELVARRFAAADAHSAVFLNYGGPRGYVIGNTAAYITLTDDTVLIGSLHYDKVEVECSLDDVTDVEVKKAMVTARFGDKHRRLIFSGSETALDDKDWKALDASMLALFGLGTLTMPNPVHLVKEIGASWRNGKQGPAIADLWYALLVGNVRFPAALDFFGAQIAYDTEDLATAFGATCSFLESLMEMELNLRNCDPGISVAAVREVVGDLDDVDERLAIPNWQKMAKPKLLTASIETLKRVREADMTELFGAEAVDTINERIFADA